MPLLQQANTAFRQKRLQEAIRLYQEALTLYPELAPFIQFNHDLAVRKARKQGKYPVKSSIKDHTDIAECAKLRVLFVLPGAIDSNNGYHVQLLLRDLTSTGMVHCTVTTPDICHKTADPRTLPFSAVTAAETPHSFDLIHAWTPREAVRELCEHLLTRHPCSLVVHLEDNEEYLTAAVMGRPFTELARLTETELDRIIPRTCFHPHRGKQFLQRAQGVTMIIDSLAHFKEEHIPGLVIAPPVDQHLFYPRPPNLLLRQQLGIAENQVVLVYTGNVHAANVHEVRQLYEAVELLNSQGTSALLLRTGQNCGDWEYKKGFSEYIRHLGWVERDQVPEILAAADVLVQPGKPGPFNDQRIPCKLPEYFAMGRPIILPKTNIGLQVRHEHQGYVLDNADSVAIAQAVQTIIITPALRERLARGSLEFFRANFARQSMPLRLIQFYSDLVSPYKKEPDQVVS